MVFTYSYLFGIDDVIPKAGHSGSWESATANFHCMVAYDVKSKPTPWRSCDLAPKNFYRDSG